MACSRANFLSSPNAYIKILYSRSLIIVRQEVNHNTNKYEYVELYHHSRFIFVSCPLGTAAIVLNSNKYISLPNDPECSLSTSCPGLEPALINQEVSATFTFSLRGWPQRACRVLSKSACFLSKRKCRESNTKI